TTRLDDRPAFGDADLARLNRKIATNFTKGRIASPGIYAMNALRLTELLQTSGPRSRRNPNECLGSRSRIQTLPTRSGRLVAAHRSIPRLSHRTSTTLSSAPARTRMDWAHPSNK